MLSFEKLPSDPSCHPQPLIIKRTSHDLGDDEKASQIPSNPEVAAAADLSRHPKFSIRDYVFTSRSKDVKNSWPFSEKHLQLCLENGVKNLLPPFQSLDELRNQPKNRCTVENENKITVDVAEPRVHVHDVHVVLDSSNNNTKLKEKLEEASCRSEGENDLPSTVTSISQSEIEESVPTNRLSSSPLGTDISLEEAASVEEAAGPPTVVIANKTATTTRPFGKKCKLVVKYNTHPERNSTEDIASNCTAVSETMNSKICPVCKTFSSSSNTTLNAHIDQCLSGESTPKWTGDSKIITRHRIKPRKTKLMVDIYTTAQHCTLEDLDRRNGSSWATCVSSFPTDHQGTEKSEMPVEEKRQSVSTVHPDDIDVGAVYVDASGTKVRILSKFDDAASPSGPKVVEHLRPRKPLKQGIGSKFLSAKKQKRHSSKHHHNYLKLVPQSKNFFSPKPHYSQIEGGQEIYVMKEGCKEDGQKREKQQVGSCNPGAFRLWACSKRTGLVKKLNKKQLSPNFLVETGGTSLDNSLVERNRGRKPMSLSGSQISSPENSGSLENACYEDDQASDKSSESPRRKRVGSPLLGADLESSLHQNKHHFSEDRNFAADSCMQNFSNSNENFAPLMSDGTVGSAVGLTDNVYSLPDASTKSSKSRDAPRSNARKFLPPKKNVLSVGNSSAVKIKGHERAEGGKQLAAWDSEADQRYDFMHNCAGKRSRRGNVGDVSSPCRSNVLERRQNRGSANSNGRNETMAVESSQFAPEFYEHDERENMYTSVGDVDQNPDEVDGLGVAQREEDITGNDNVTERPSLIGFRETDAKSNCLSYEGPISETEALTSPTDRSISNEQEMFCGEGVEDDDTLGSNVHSVVEMDSEGCHGSYFHEVVDPIPIPGPPGSFLPSPRDMGSDDFQGNSSLTTSRVQSSHDQLDFIDGDSSDSPASTTSTISNSTETKLDLKYSEPYSSIAQSVQEQISSSLSRTMVDPSVEVNAAPAQERLAFDRENLKVNMTSLERGPFSFKSDDQPCRCQRKERTSQGVALNYQESPLLRRRAMGKQIACNPNSRVNNAEMNCDMKETFFPSDCPTPRSERIVFPVTKSSASPISVKGDCDSVSPSASNSVLRLMGKNLMVVNRDEDASAPPPAQPQPYAQTNHVSSQLPTFSRIVPGNQNQSYNPFHRNYPHGSVIFGQDLQNKVGECFDATNFTSFRRPANNLFPQQHTDGGFVTSMESQGDYKFPIPQNMYASKPIGGGASTFQHKNSDSASSYKEIIIIDDPETEADHFTSNVSGLPVSAAPIYNSKRVTNPFSCYESSPDPSLLCGSPVLYNSCSSNSSSVHAIPSPLANASPARWQALQRSTPYLAATPSASSRGHLRPTVYNSPSLS